MLEMKEWDGFEGRLWKEEINVRQFIQDNYTPMMVTRISLQNLQRLPINFGEHCRNCRRKSAQRAESSIWRPRL